MIHASHSTINMNIISLLAVASRKLLAVPSKKKACWLLQYPVASVWQICCHASSKLCPEPETFTETFCSMLMCEYVTSMPLQFR